MLRQSTTVFLLTEIKTNSEKSRSLSPIVTIAEKQGGGNCSKNAKAEDNKVQGKTMGKTKELHNQALEPQAEEP